MSDKFPPDASTPTLFSAEVIPSDTARRHEQPPTALAQMPISNDKKTTPTSDNTEHAMTLADTLAPLQQRERKTKKTPHSDTKTAPPPMTNDDDNKTTFHISQPAGQEEEEDAPLGQHDRATAEDQ